MTVKFTPYYSKIKKQFERVRQSLNMLEQELLLVKLSNTRKQKKEDMEKLRDLIREELKLIEK